MRHSQINSMEHSLPSEDNSHLNSQEIPRLRMEPEGPLPCSQQLATGPYPEPYESNPQPDILFR